MKKIKLNKKPVIITSIIFLIIAVIAILITKKTVTKENTVLSNVILLNKTDVLSVKQGSLNEVVNFTGDLTAKEQTMISAEVDAKILKVWVEEGQLVKSGQVLADLDTQELLQAVNQQNAQVSAAKARLDLDKQKMDKQAELLKEGFVSKIAYDELVSNYQSSLDNYKAQQAMLKRSQKQLADTHIIAPFSGVVYQKNIQQGQLALKNTKLFALANLDNLEIKAAISSDQINKIAIGQKVVFHVETNKQDYSGVISRVNQVSEAGTRSYMVYIDFDNKISGLKAGQFVKGQIILNGLENQLIVNCDTIRTNESGTYIFTLNQNVVRAVDTQIILSNRDSNMCSISNVKVGQYVLLGNVLTVKSGDRVKIVD